MEFTKEGSEKLEKCKKLFGVDSLTREQISLSNVMATLARARTAATGSSSVVDLAFDVVPPPV